MRRFSVVVVTVFLVCSLSAQAQPTDVAEQVRNLVHRLRFQLPAYGLDQIPSVVDEIRKIGPQAAPYVIEGLQDASAHSDFRREACAKLLGEWKDPRALRPLIQQLSRSDQRSHVSQAIVKYGASAVAPLLEELKTPTTYQASVAWILGEIGDKKAIDSLVVVLKTGRYSERREAAVALGKIGDTRAFEPLRDALDTVPRGAVVGLGLLGDRPATPHLLASFKSVKRHKDNAFDEDAIRAIGRLKDERSIPLLLETAKNVGHPARNQAVAALGNFQDERALALLLDFRAALLKGERLPASADGGGGGAGPGASLPDPFPDLVAEALCKIAAKTPTPFLKALDDKNRDRRDAALIALLAAGMQQAKPHVLTAFRNGDRHLVYKLLDTLAGKPDAAYVDAVIAWMKGKREMPYARITKYWAAVGKPCVPTLIKALDSEEQLTWNTAATALARIDDPRAVVPLQSLARRVPILSGGFSTDVIDFFERHDSEENRDLLMAAVKADKTWNGVYPATALAKRKDERAIAPLLTAISNRYPYVRYSAAQALGGMQTARAFEALSLMIKNNDEIPKELVGGLAKTDSDRTVKILIDGFATANPARAEELAQKFSEVGSAAVPALVAVVDSKQSTTVRRLAALALGECGDARAAEPLTRVYLETDSLQVRTAVRTALINLGPAAIDPLMKWVRDDEKHVVNVCQVLKYAGRGVVPILTGTDIKSVGGKAVIIRTLGDLADSRAVDYIVAAMEEDATLRPDGVRALTQIGDKRSVDAMVASFGPRSHNNDYVFKTLAKIGEPAVPSLIKLLGEPDRSWYAVHTLSLIVDLRAAQPMVELLAKQKGKSRAATISALGKIRHPSAVPALIDAAKSDPLESNRVAAIYGLYYMGDARARRPLEKMLASDKSTKVRAAAKYTLQWLPLK